MSPTFRVALAAETGYDTTIFDDAKEIAKWFGDNLG